MPNYETNDYEYLRSKQADDAYWDERIRRRNVSWQAEHHPERMANNPNAERVGAFTGRCRKCGSNDLWDDVSCYGCNKCGATFGQ
jgi:ribosomal protein L40E